MAWYDDKDNEREAEQNEIWCCHSNKEEIKKRYETMREKYSYLKELERHEEENYSIFEINALYGIKYRVDDFSSYFICSDEKVLQAFKLDFYKTKQKLKDFSQLSAEEQNMFIEIALKKYDEYLKVADEYFVLMQMFINKLKHRGENNPIVKIGVGINRKTGHPNFQIFLDTRTLEVKETNFGFRFKKPEEVNIFGKVYFAKNFGEIKTSEAEELEFLNKRNNFTHDFQYVKWFDDALYKYASELFKKIQKFNYYL